ncbi:glycoside hydrolase family 76 protein [Karstenula rhodostoma CBS 690.94]|uniref:mannan endo-1,6-alpha-mannosidase n=1 Tax=Karstenula rhodostoma CBS 690.94 TaxID=1392251 RepID=A0A9P4PB68_9PLEO|nr:glycoside hydrolase family 76 protein [Karstenula rhodostoma CBS 690.94]
MRRSAFLSLLPTLLSLTHAQTTESLVVTAAQIAQSIKLSLPNPSLVLVPQPYYWWQSGIVNNALFTYGFVTGDKQFEDLAKNTLYNQATGANDFMMPEATGNDDQAWWALSALTAVENGVAVPAGSPTFLSMAQNVFNEQKARWDESSCSGGMRFKIRAGDAGYEYKSSIANGLFFQLAARLAKLTGDADARAWAEKTYDWITSTGLIDAAFNVYDGTDAASGCVDLNTNQWSYNVGAFLYGAAVMASQTGDKKWVDRTHGLLEAAQRNFVRDGALYESICEGRGTCNNDQVSFKGILARWLGATAVELPDLKNTIAVMLRPVSGQVQRSWAPSLGPMQQFVALESVNAAIRASGGVAAAFGMIGGSKTVVKRKARRSLAGRIVWDA